MFDEKDQALLRELGWKTAQEAWPVGETAQGSDWRLALEVENFVKYPRLNPQQHGHMAEAWLKALLGPLRSSLSKSSTKELWRSLRSKCYDFWCPQRIHWLFLCFHMTSEVGGDGERTAHALP